MNWDKIILPCNINSIQHCGWYSSGSTCNLREPVPCNCCIGNNAATPNQEIRRMTQSWDASKPRPYFFSPRITPVQHGHNLSAETWFAIPNRVGACHAQAIIVALSRDKREELRDLRAWSDVTCSGEKAYPSQIVWPDFPDPQRPDIIPQRIRCGWSKKYLFSWSFPFTVFFQIVPKQEIV